MKRSSLKRSTIPLKRTPFARKPVKRSFSLKRSTIAPTPKSPLKQAVKRADEAFAKYIKARNNRCMLRGLDQLLCEGSLECMHLIGRGNFLLRLDEKNALAGCHGHHAYYTAHPKEWEELLIKHFLDLWIYINNLKKMESPHYKEYDYREITERYKEKLKLLIDKELSIY